MAWRGDAFEVRYQLYVELPQDLHDELQQLDRLLTPTQSTLMGRG
jgi:hypothetical protein